MDQADVAEAPGQVGRCVPHPRCVKVPDGGVQDQAWRQPCRVGGGTDPKFCPARAAATMTATGDPGNNGNIIVDGEDGATMAMAAMVGAMATAIEGATAT